MLSAFAGKHGITYPLLSDADSAVIRRLGLLHEDVVAGVGISSGPLRPDQVGMAYPGVFLLDEQGVVTSKRFFASFRQRETGVALLEQGFGVAATEFGAVAEGGSEGVRVRASLDSDTYRPFQRLWLTLQVAVANELHIYGRPIPDGYTPLSVEVAPMEGLTVGEPEWPPPHPFRIDGLDEQFMVYEGAVALALPITFGTRDAGDLTLHITVRYQACSSTDCLMPASVALELPVRAAALVT